MDKRVLGRTGIAVTPIGVGAWQLGGPLLLDGKADGHPDLGEGHVTGLIRRCGEMGINLIDTAEQYGAGESERRVGRALEGQRDRWVVSTKFGAQVGPAGGRVNDVSAKRLPASLEGSLKRLRTDYIDVYLYHAPPDRNEAEAVANYLEDAKRRGVIRAAGISTNSLEDVEYLFSLGCCDVVQFQQNLVEPEAALAGFLSKHNLGGVVRGAFAAGRLSGRYFRTPPAFTGDDIRTTWFKGVDVGREYARYAAFEELVTSKRTMPQLALRWLLDRPTTHTIILGAKTAADYEAAVRAADLPPLTAAENARVEAIRSSLARPKGGILGRLVRGLTRR